MTDEEGGGTEETEPGKNAKDRTAGHRHQEGCLRRRGPEGRAVMSAWGGGCGD